MTVYLDRYRLLLQPDVNAPEFNPSLNPADKLRALKILQKDSFKFLNHRIKNVVRLIIEIFGALIPDQNIKVDRIVLEGREIYLIQFTDNNAIPTSFDGEWTGHCAIKAKLNNLSFCLYSEKLDKKYAWYITECCLASVGKL